MDNQLTKQDVEQIQKAIGRVEKKVDDGLLELREDLRKIELYLYDDKDTNSQGLVQQVRSHEKRIGNMEEETRFRKRVIAGIGILGAAAVTAIYEFIKWLATKT